MNKPVCYLVCGKSGVGKTTFSKELSKRLDLVYLEADDYYRKLNGNEIDRNNKFDVWIELYKEIHRNEINGKSIILDSNSLTENDRGSFLAWFSYFEFHLIWCYSDNELRYKNNQSRTRIVPQQAMKRMDQIEEIPVWNKLDKKFKSLIKIINENNKFYLSEKNGETDYINKLNLEEKI